MDLHHQGGHRTTETFVTGTIRTEVDLSETEVPDLDRSHLEIKLYVRKPLVRRMGLDMGRALGFATRLLPPAHAERYAEEWRSELYDLRAEGARWYKCASFVAGVLTCAVPKMAVILRLGRRRAVE